MPEMIPGLVVEVVIRTDAGVVLMKREMEPHKGKWHIPGGKVLRGEILSDAAKRLAREEAGVEVEVEKVLGYIEYPESVNVRGGGWSLGIAFQAKISSGEPKGMIFKELPEEMVWEQKNFLKKK